MPISPRLSRAVGHYDPNNESEFRGDVDRSIKSLENQIALLRGARSNEFAKSALRENSIISDGDIKSYPEDFPAYFSGNQAISYGQMTFPENLTWYDLTDGYGNLVSSNFSEDASTGEIEYTGNVTGKFLFQYGGSFETKCYARYYFLYLRLAKDTGGGFSAVSGSAIGENAYGNFVTGGYIYRFPRMSGATIVELDAGDKIKVQYGIDVLGVAVTFAYLGTQADGVNLAISSLVSG